MSIPFRKYHSDEIAGFIERQLETWPLAEKNYTALGTTERRPFKIGDLEGALQFNPARIVSTGAKVSNGKVESRPCFLCAANRPAEQTGIEILPGWDMLVNPYPIFPVHLTIVSRTHQPQERVPEAIVEIAERLPGMAVFFNGAKAGASAPDHLHLQAVLKEELPLLRLAEEYHKPDMPGLMSSENFNLELPFFFLSGLISPENTEMKILQTGLRAGGSDDGENLNDPGLVNTFFWTDEGGNLRFIVIPRRRHRPECYYADGEAQRLVSPGSIDMAGILILPREEDFKRMTEEEIKEIYQQTGFPQ